MPNGMIPGNYICGKCGRSFGYKQHFATHKKACHKLPSPEELVALWHDGEPLYRLAERFDVHKNFVRNTLLAGGLDEEAIAARAHDRRGRPPNFPIPSNDTLVRLHKAGMPITRIAAIYGVWPQLIYERFREVRHDFEAHSVLKVPMHGRIYELPDWAPEPHPDSKLPYDITRESCSECGAKVEVVNGYCLFCREDGYG